MNSAVLFQKVFMVICYLFDISPYPKLRQNGSCMHVLYLCYFKGEIMNYVGKMKPGVEHRETQW